MRPLWHFTLQFLLFFAGSATASPPLLQTFTPRSFAVYHDTLFFGGTPDRDHPKSPLLAVGDGRGQPFETPVPSNGPWGDGTAKISHLAVFQGDLVVVGDFSGGAPMYGESKLYLHDGLWRQFPVQPPGNLGSLSDILVADGVLYLAGRFRNPETGVTDNVIAFDGQQWHRLGLCHGYQYVTTLGAHEGRVIAAAGIRRQELGEDYVHRAALNYNISSWDGTSWTTLREGQGGMPTSLHSMDGKLYVGFFLLAEAKPHPSVLQFEGEDWAPVGSSFGTGSSSGFVKVAGLGSYRGRLVAVGQFDRVAGFQVPGAAYLDGNQWHPLGLEIKGLPLDVAVFDQAMWVGQMPRKDVPGLNFWNSDIPKKAPQVPVIDPVPLSPPSSPVTPPFRNGDFAARIDSHPVGWTYEKHPSAYLMNSTEVGVDTLSWSAEGNILVPPKTGKGMARYLAQDFPTQEGRIYRVRVRARIVQEESEGHLPPRFSLTVGHSWDRLEIRHDEFRWYELALPGRKRTGSGRISFSGSRGSGFLEVAEVQLTEHPLDFAQVFDKFCLDFSDQYAHLEFSTVDWDSLTAHWRPLAAKAVSCQAFHNMVLKMLGAMNDPKISTETRSGDVMGRRMTSVDPAEEARTQAARRRARPLYRGSPLRDDAPRRPDAEYVEVDGHRVFYFSVNAVARRLNPESDEEFLAEAASAEAILLDLRHFRWGEEKGGFPEAQFGKLPKVPTVVLIDPTTWGVGADMAIALKGQSHVTLVGQETGTPSQVMGTIRVGCGFLVHLPSFQVELFDGTVVNGRHGLVPDILVEEDWETGWDEIRQQGMEILRERLMH
jgi:hypothetical protein